MNVGAIGSSFLERAGDGWLPAADRPEYGDRLSRNQGSQYRSRQRVVLGTYFLYTFEIQLHLSLWISILLALAASAVAGALTHVIVMKRVIGQPLFVPAIITLGLAMIITAAVDMVWGGANIYLPLPVSSQVYQVKGVAVTTYGVVAIAAAVLAAGIFLLFERRTKTGVQLRAAASDPLLAGLSGIPVNRLYIIGWAMGSMAAARRGNRHRVLDRAQPWSVEPGLAALAPVVLAGFNNVIALVIASAITGELESFTQLYGNANASSAVAFGVLLIVVFVRPQGILKTAPAGARL